MSTSSPLTAFIRQTENYLDSVVEQGSDQELFISSYLHGHFAVAAAQSLMQQMTQISQLEELMEASLHTAFQNQELSMQDQQQVQALWHRLLTLV